MVDTVWHAQATLGHKTETDALLISVTQTKSWPALEHVLPAMLALYQIAQEEGANPT